LVHGCTITLTSVLVCPSCRTVTTPMHKHPIRTVTRLVYTEHLNAMPKSIDWSKLSDYEKEDKHAGTQTLACSGDSCE
jgi:hypothetical protein